MIVVLLQQTVYSDLTQSEENLSDEKSEVKV